MKARKGNLVYYRRVNPDDWDDDGDPNDTDPNPYVHDGDSFGPHRELPQGANSNAYCWVDIVVSNANALVTFTGDGPSALPDPRFVARAGETNRVTILIGKTYVVSCDMPIAVADKSDSEIQVSQHEARKLYVHWPVEIWSEDYGSHFEMFVSPDWLGGSFSWSTNGCCEITGGGAFYTFLRGGGCGCDGCSIDGHYQDAVTSEAVSDAGTYRRVYKVRSRHIDPSWNLVKVTRRGFGVANENVTINPVEKGFGLTIK